MVSDVTDIKDTTLRLQVHSLMNRMLTAPKARGSDDVRILYVDGEEKARLAAAMRAHGETTGRGGFLRDAANVEKATALVIAGAKRMVMELDCGFCGAPTCQQALADDLNCAFPVTDLGIAIGSGVAFAAEQGLDNRVMYTIGLAALKLDLFGDPQIRVALGVPFSVSPKNVFFDRRHR